ncbi:gliding motility lipoprotein GldB [Winogradskyella endarachnes]|uniref:Gliding motility lipoprotein GldB n=1 Tax=Winogradskyella endarachnes TaxID=2681965 RepID=A0A6L6UDE6_9FLAO|nr:gliding motility lipoprotein GldB [Winogradskyella endarachnes]MUU78877.1 gliding motility lipoprotein GldB [Winogradskyella endarachnes]
MQIRFYVIILGLLLFSCEKESKVEKEIAQIEVNFDVERFDKAFAEAKPEDLGQLKGAYPFFFSTNSDTYWVEKMNDSLQKVLLHEVQLEFTDFKGIKEEFKSLFQHLKFYDKAFKIPRVITLTNDVDYRNKTFVNDSIVLVALDNYLGADHEFYQNIPMYIASNMEKNQIISDVTGKYASKYMFQTKRSTFLDEMIYFGKLLYFKDVIIPFKTDAEKIGYSDMQLKWAEVNESQIWSHFIEKEMLYSTDAKLASRFIADAPFSKFGLELDNDSPGRLGQYIGWQIVKAYAENTEASILNIMQTEPEEIFTKAKFKPKK